MLESLLDTVKAAASDAVDIAAAPVEIVGHAVRAVTKPLAEMSKDIVESVKEELDG